MKKPKKSPLGIIKIALLIPAVLVTLGLTIGMTPQQKTVTGKVIFADTGEPATGASVVVRGGTLGCVVDTEGTFMLNVDGNPDLVISFVGYSSLVVNASDVGKKPLELEVKTYSMDLESVPLEVKKDASQAPDAFFVVDEMPTFKGGDPAPEFRKYIAENLRYPESAAKNKISGRVIVQFMVNKNGDVVNPVVVRAADPALDKEAIRVVSSSPRWEAGKHEGKPVNVLFTFPINFVLDDPAAQNKPDHVTMSVKTESGLLTIRNTDGSVSTPVYVMDGEVVETVEGLDPELIEKIDVIKDPDSDIAKKYNAKDGVILITTKEAAAAKYSQADSFEKEGEIFYIVEDMPKFPGGKPALKTYIYSNLEYPEKAKNQGIEGEVQVRFLVNEKGKVESSEILRSTYQGFDAPALKVVNEMPDWTPGMQRGKAVKVWYVVSIKFNDEKL